MTDRPTFCTWLSRELSTGRMALLGLYEKRDHIQYVEAPALRRKYMELIGAVEESVLEAELEVFMLRRKIELIQSSLNRREPVDMEAINREIEKEKARRIEELEQEDLTLNEIPQLTEQEERTIQRQYREITDKFHPVMNPDVSETQKDLYHKALEAYKLRDVEAMHLVYDMLLSPMDEEELKIVFESHEMTGKEQRAEYYSMANALSVDYRLAKKLYSFFKPPEADKVVLDKLQFYEDERMKVEEQIKQLRAGFPFNAVDTMNDRAKTEEYLAELRVRGKRCEEEKAKLEHQIEQMTEGKAGTSDRTDDGRQSRNIS